MSTSPTLKPKKNLVSIGKAAEILGVSIDTIRRWNKAGAIHTYREEGKARRFSLDELREMKASKPLSISEAAIKLGVSASTLRRIEKKGLLVPQRNSIGEREYSRNSIKTYIAREGQQNKGVPLSTNDAIETEIDQIPVPARVLIDNSVYASEKAREFPVYEPRAAGMFASESESARNEVEPRIADAAIRKISRTQYKFNARNIFMATSMLGFIAMLVFGAIGAQTVFNSVTKDRAVAVRLNFEKVDKQPQVLAASTDKGLLSRINDSLSQLLARLPWSSSANKNVSIVAQVKKDAQVNIADVQKALASSAISEKETIYFAIPAVFQKNITAPNVIYSVTAGTGVTITGDTQNPVINAVSSTVASGVSSLQGSTGSVVLTAGSGISIDGLTISSSISSSTEQTFNTISVSGQSDVVADSSTDTLTLTAGTGIVITTDASGDIVTITNSGSSSASGFIDNGTVVSLTTSTDNVTLGSTTDLAKLGIDGEADEIQLLVQGNSTQTTSLIVAENSSGTDVYTVSNTGDVVQTGSLTFSSVGTDITTGSGEDLTVVANGIGIINLNDNVVITGTTDLQGNVSNSTGTLTFADNVSITGSTTLGDNTSDTITFNAGVSGAGISFASSTFGTCTALETVGGVLTCGSDDTGGAGAWIDGGGFVYLTSSSNNVGVGTSAPTGKLQIAGDTDEIQLVVTGNATQTSNLLTLEQSNGTDVFTVTNAGNTTINGNTTLGDNTSDTITFNAGVSGAGISFASSTFGTCTALETVGGVLTCGSDAGGSDSGWIDGGSNVYLITSSDNVGIGTTAPGAKLDVVGSGLFSQNLTVTGSVSAATLNISGNGAINGNTTLGDATTDTVTLTAKIVGASGSALGFSDGSFTTCTALETVNGMLTCGTDDVGGGAGVWTDGTATAYLAVSSDWVGIGTSTPTDKVNILASTSGSTSFDGLQIDFTQDDDADSADTNAGLNINITSSSSDQDTVLGINIAGITASASAVERGIQIGSGWDSNLYFNDTTTNIGIANSGTFTFNDGTNTLLSIVDAGTTGNVTTTGTFTVNGNTALNGATSIGDTYADSVTFYASDIVLNGGNGGNPDGTIIAFNEALTLADVGLNNKLIISDLANTTGQGANFNFTSANSSIDSVLLLSFGTVTNGVDGLQIDFTQSSDADSADTNAGLNINVTSSSTNADTLLGINIANITGGSAVERGIQIGSGWDSNLYFNDTTTNIGIANSGTFAFNDGTNTLFSIVDAGTTGNVTTTGTFNVNGNTTLGDATTDTVTLTAKIAGASGSALGFSDGSFTTCTALETVNGMLTCGTDDSGGAGVWTDGTATAYLAVSSDWVGIGTSTPTDKVNILASTSGSASFDGLQIDFTQSDDTDSTDANAGLNINITSSSSDPDTLYGINIAAITGGSARETGLNVGSGWDYSALFAGKVGIGTTAPSNVLSVYTTTANDGIYLDGTDRPTIQIASSGVTRARFGVSTGAGQLSSDSVANDVVIRTEGTNLLFNTNTGSSNAALALSSTGTALFKNTTNSTTAFVVQNSGGTSLLTVDTSNSRINLKADVETLNNISSPYGGTGVVGNKLGCSQDFAETYCWTPNNLTVSSNNSTAPDATLTADTLSGSASNSTITYTNSAIDGAGTYTFSVWLKSNSGNIPSTLRLDSTAGSPTTGTAVSVTATTEWKRFSVTQIFTGSPTAISPVITITNSGETVVAWGAQVQTGTSMGVYTPTGSSTTQEAGAVVNGILRLYAANATSGNIYFGAGDSNNSTTLGASGLQVPGNSGDFGFNIDTTGGLFKFQSGGFTALTIRPSAYNTGTGILISGSAPSSVTQTGAVTGLSLDQSTNFTVPNSSAGNQTGINLTIKDGGASATSKGISIQGTADTGISFGGTITNLIDATNFKVSSLGVATLGSANQAGSLVINDGTSSTVTIKSGTQVAATNYDITIPPITGSDTICLQSFANCGGASVWIDGTANAYLSVSSDWVGIGTSTPTDKLNVLASTSGSTSFDGLQIDFTQDDDADSADTNAGLNINITSSSSDQDTVLGINIANITGGSAFERGLQIGSGWDSNLYFNDTTTNISIANSGTFTFNDGTNTLFSIVDTGTNADLIITGGVTFAAFTNGGLGCSALETTATGALNCGTDDTTGGSAPGWTDGGFNVYLSTLNDLVGIGTTTPTDKLNILASTSGSAAFDGLQIDFTLSSDGDSADNNAGLNINLTQSSSDIDTLNGINISITGASASARERGISIGTGFDDDIYFASASATLRIQSGGQIAITDNFIGGGASSDLPLARLKEYFSDANFGVWEAGGFINLDGSYRMDNFINPGSASADISGASKLGDNQDWVVDEAATGAGGTATQQVGCQVGVGGGNTNLTYGTSNQLNGVMYMKLDSNSVTNTPNTWCAMYHADTAGSNATRMAQLNAANKFIMYYKVRPDSNYTATNTPSNNNLFFWLGANQHTQGYFGKSTLTSNNNLIAFTNLNGTQTQTGTNATAGTVWNGWVQNGTAATNISTVSCSNANISTATNAWALMRIEARATNDVHFFIDGDVSNGVSLSECGGGITSNIPTGMLRPQIMAAQNGGTVTVTRGLFVDLFAFVQDDVRDGTTPQQALSTDAELANTTQEIPDIMGGADLAEHYYVPEGQEIHPGEIVSLGNYAGQVNKSTRPYDRKLLGVVSESPGLEIGQAAANSVPVALTGRVSVKVNGSGGAIKIGDPITPSLISGEGMKATEAGKILGTAMEAYTAEGSGTIMVNVNVGYYLGDELGLEQNDEIGFGQSELASGSATLANSPVIAIRSYVYKGLTEFWNKVTFKETAEFWAEVVFKSTVRFEGQVEFNKDTAGYATIRKGEKFVDVAFDNSYQTEPIVNLSINVPQVTDELYQELIASGECDATEGKDACQDKVANLVLGEDIKEGVTGKSSQGFMIILNKPAPIDITYSWQAIAVKNAKTSVTKTTQELLNEASGSAQLDQGDVAGEATPSAIITPIVPITPTPFSVEELTPTPSVGP